MKKNRPLWLTHNEKENLARELWEGLQTDSWEKSFPRSRGPLTLLRKNDKWEFRTSTGAYLGSTDEILHLITDLIRPEFKLLGENYLKQGIVCAAPHGEYDWNSEKIVTLLSDILKIPAVIAQRFRFPADFQFPEMMPLYLNVNRPTENKKWNGKYTREVVTSRAGMVYNKYQKALIQAAGIQAPPIKMLIEIHSHRRDNSLQIATTGLNNISSFKSLLQKKLNQSDLSVELLVEPDDELHWKASYAKQYGAFRKEMTNAGLHMELPQSMANNHNWSQSTRVLGDFFKELFGNFHVFFIN